MITPNMIPMNKADQRRQNQVNFLHSNLEIEVGDISRAPLDLEQLLKIDGNSRYVEKHFTVGLTADIYKLAVNGTRWTLKRKRDEILVRSLDGQLSFLNEVERRRDFEELKRKDPEAYQGIVDTTYASLNRGIILSPWIEGTHVKEYNREIFESLFETLYHVESAGLFEYDLCPGNLLLRPDGTICLFDFGYMYPYNPLEDYNPDGDACPIFHCAERFETRSFMQYLMDMEESSRLEEILKLYGSEKEIALKYYTRKYENLKKAGADRKILDWLDNFINTWRWGLENLTHLKSIYDLESFRSYVLDVHDDVSGKSCTGETIKKIDRVIARIENRYDSLRENHAFFFGDENLSYHQLLQRYEEIRNLVHLYQLKHRR